LLSSGCIEQINYDVSTEKDRIVISGLITSSFESQVVQVKRSILTGSGNLTNSTPIVNAEVKISSSTNSFTFSHTTDGNYTALFSAIPNEEYVLEVTVGENMYRSSPQKMPQPQPMLNAKSNLIQKQSLNSSGNLVNNQFVSVSLDGNISTNLKVIYRVFGQYEFMEFNPPSTMQKTCYVNDQIDNNTIKLLSANDLRTTAIENYNILEVPFDARFLRLY
ncbi:MAG TPA: DUF4249 family protein, partial [Saprospiraceae bacterium]|nr:DUF4249 family protein [Saprospiraceae bacterium]